MEPNVERPRGVVVTIPNIDKLSNDEPGDFFRWVTTSATAYAESKPRTVCQDKRKV